MGKYRRKPEIIDAIQWDGNASTANDFLGDQYEIDWKYANKENGEIWISQVACVVEVGNWILKSHDELIWILSDPQFDSLYEKVEDATISELTQFSENNKQ